MDPIFAPITVGGFNGSEPEPARLGVPPENMTSHQAMAWHEASDAAQAAWWNWRVARLHRHLIPLARRAEPEKAAWIAAAEQCEAAWAALTQAPTDRWASAHHGWLASQEPVRDALARYAQVYAEIDQLRWSAIGGERTLAAYDETVPPERNLNNRYYDDPDSALRDFDIRCEQRKKTAAQTLQHLQTA